MVKLYLDNTENLVIGLLDDSFHWISYECSMGKRGSRCLHENIYRDLKKNGLNVGDVTEIIQSSGPGSYTGTRLTEGLSQIFEWQGVRVCNFYHFEIPQLMGIGEGVWLSRAFKKEVFVYRWNPSHSCASLMGEEGFPFGNFGAVYYTNCASPYFPDAGLTSKMVEEKPSKILGKISKRSLRFAPYYYRHLENEFRLPGKR